MRTKAAVSRLVTIFLFVGINVAHGGAPIVQKGVTQKGHSVNRTGQCCHHCKEDRGSRGAADRGVLPRFSRAPIGVVVDSVPVVRAVPSLVSMPMMAGIPVARAARGTDDERIDELDARVEALHLRMVTIQRSIELQTKILQELSATGSIGGKRIPGVQ